MPHEETSRQDGLTMMQYRHRYAVDGAMAVDLKDIPLFRGLREDELRALAANTAMKSFPKNVIVLHEGESTQAFYVILTGKVKAYLNDESGKEILLDLRGPGQYFGEMMLDGGAWPASVVTLEPCEVGIISGTDFKKLLIVYPDVALNVISNLVQTARGLTENVRGRASDVYGKVSRMLLAHAVERGGNLVIPEKLTQQEIANRVGTAREVVNRVLRALTVNGYISIRAGTITIKKPLPSRCPTQSTGRGSYANYIGGLVPHNGAQHPTRCRN